MRQCTDLCLDRQVVLEERVGADHVELVVLDPRELLFGVEVGPGDVAPVPAKTAQRLERANLRHPRGPRVHPVRIRVLQLGGVRGVVGRGWRRNLLFDRRHSHRLRKGLGVVDLGARDRNCHCLEADADRFFRLRLHEAERALRIEVRAERAGAELQRICRRIGLLGTNRAGEEERHVGALRFGDHRRVGGRQAAVDKHQHVVLRQFLRVRGGARRLRAIVENDQADLLAVDPTSAVDVVDVDAHRLDDGRIDAGTRPGHRGRHADGVGVLCDRGRGLDGDERDKRRP